MGLSMIKNWILVLVFVSTVALGQPNIHESVYMHVSGSDLLVGETLYYSPYVFSSQTGKLSDLSRILYVELLKSNGEPVYQTKLLLENGKGQGQYFIPSDLETGVYHLVAYTRWMKNFDDFSEQSLAIINPYVSQDFIKALETDVEVAFYPEGGTFLEGIKNRLVLQTTNSYGQGLEVKGKIVSKSGDLSIDVSTDTFGYFEFDFTPQPDESYQFILETKDQFKFFELPKASANGVGLKIVDASGFYKFDVRGNESNHSTLGTLIISGRGGIAKQQTAAINSSISLQKRELPEGLLEASIRVEDSILTSRLFWNGPRHKIEVADLGHFNKLSEVEVAFEIPDSSQVSVSVERVSSPKQMTKSQSILPWMDKIRPQWTDEFVAQASREQWDRVLIASFGRKKQDLDSVKYLPEYRSGLVQGVIRDSLGTAHPDVPVGLAVAGSSRQFQATKTDEKGQFVLPYHPKNPLEINSLSVIGDQHSWNIDVAPEYYLSYEPFNDAPIVFDSIMVQAIIKRSIRNQLNNAYSDTTQAENWPNRPEQFYGMKTYLLDDYTRFSTMRDTFIELIIEVGVSKNESDFGMKMRSEESRNRFFSDDPTLLLLDGGFVSSKDLLNLSPYVVERIEVLNKRYYFGEIIFDGVISVVTFKGDRGEVATVGQDLKIAPVQLAERTGATVPASPDTKRPYFQDLLYWQPASQYLGEQLSLKFNTSETTGLFQIRMEGVAPSGEQISRMAYFEVK